MYKIRGIDQKEYGPVDADMVRRWIADGRANAQTLGQAEGSVEWKPLSSFAEFADALAARTLPPVMQRTPPPLAPTPTPASKQSGLAITSMVMGILSLLTCGITSLFGLICGIVSLVKIRKSRGALRGEGFAIAGICVSGVTLLLLPFLAAIAIPNFVKARQQAQFGRFNQFNQFNQCVQNARQLSLAVRIYANDNNERYPTAKQWCDAITPFVGGSTRVFTCPQHGGARCSFAFNQNLEGKKESQADPSTVMIFESDLGWNATGNASQMIQTPRHGNYTIGFADGHVEQVPAARLGQLRWEP